MVARMIARRTLISGLSSSRLVLNNNKTPIPDPSKLQNNWEKQDTRLPLKITEHQLVQLTGRTESPTDRVLLEKVNPTLTKRDFLHLIQKAQVPIDEAESITFERDPNRPQVVYRVCIKFTHPEAAILFMATANSTFMGGRQIKGKFINYVPFKESPHIAGASGRSVLITGMPWYTNIEDAKRLQRDRDTADTFEPAIFALPVSNGSLSHRFIIQLENEEKAHRFARHVHGRAFIGRETGEKFPLKAQVLY
ncbi:hypothetical protein BDF19DRAFT_426430 [Syncephalis fuscata]|nr:hypothetical protein BDF19DRAFT_426430 [Syncephalis fuscata]